MIKAQNSFKVCYYCSKLCDKPEELERAWLHPVSGEVTCCDKCGGYEVCPKCKTRWENLHDEPGVPCFDCREKEEADE
jgi:hypothetical protein